MKNSKLLIAAAAFAVIGGALCAQIPAQAAVKNPSGGLIGSPQNFPTEGTYNFLNGSLGKVNGKPVKNPSGGLIGAAQNFPSLGTYSYLSGASWNAGSKPVKNPSGGLIGAAQNFPSQGTYTYVAH